VTPTRTEPTLVARSRALPDGDVLDHFVPGGMAWLGAGASFVTTGVVTTVDLGDATALLGSIEHHTEGCSDQAGPRAVGALPFSGPGRLLVPARIVGRDAHGAMWCTDIAPVGDAPSIVTTAPTSFSVTPRSTRAQWHAMVEQALDAIARGDLDKVVLARAVQVDADLPFDQRSVLDTLRNTQPGCVVYADRGFLGASPELLVRKRGDRITARPLAGTGMHADALLQSAKDAREHRFVVDAVVAALLGCGAQVHADAPAALTLPGVSHLATTITANCSDPGIDVAALVAALHPTPAVGGTPRPAALDAIAAIEPEGRGRYAGPCGWIDAHGDGEFVVALRGADIDGTRAVLHAGAGIVAGSEPNAEWAETQQKLTPMLQALVRP
jgi:menaquinone-specific isochorismate synthase